MQKPANGCFRSQDSRSREGCLCLQPFFMQCSQTSTAESPANQSIAMQRKLLIPPYVAYLDARTARESFMPVFNRARKLAIPVRPFVLQRPLFKKNLKLPTQPNQHCFTLPFIILVKSTLPQICWSGKGTFQECSSCLGDLSPGWLSAAASSWFCSTSSKSSSWTPDDRWPSGTSLCQ